MTELNPYSAGPSQDDPTTPAIEAAKPQPAPSTQPETHLETTTAPPPKGVSGGTVVWGLVLLAIAAIGGASQLLNVNPDPVLSGAGILLGAGVLLVLFAAFGGRKQRRRKTTRA